jgi:hypothetical protein
MLLHWLSSFPWLRFTLLWSGRDQAVFRAVWQALEASGILFERTRVRGFEALPPSFAMAAFYPPPMLRIRVRAEDAGRARRILRAILELSSLT